MDSAYRLDNNATDLFLEAWKLGNMIICLNAAVKRDPYIRAPFLSRRYEIRQMPDPKTATNEDIGTFYRDVFEIIDDFEDLVNETRISAENTKYID